MKAILGQLIQSVRRNSSGVELQHIDKIAILINEQGVIADICRPEAALTQCEGKDIVDFGDAWIMPGFVDTHIHFPQVNIIGAYGEKLLKWLERYTFPEEQRYADTSYAQKMAAVFTDQLLKNGTTCAAVFSTNHFDATNIIMEEFAHKNMSGWIGKSSMDRHGPEELIVPCEQDLEEVQELLNLWQKKSERRKIAITPRFAPSCTEKHLKKLGALSNGQRIPVQTHFAETLNEINLVKELFPKSASYLDVYKEFGLLHEKTILAHGIHITEQDLKDIHDAKSIVAHCPTSNLFLGSGLFPREKYEHASARFCLATDIGAGTSFSMWRTMDEAYKVQKLQGRGLNASELLFDATLGGAEAMGMENSIGSIEVGKSADLQIIRPQNIDILAQRLEHCQTAEEQVFAAITLGDNRLVDQVFLQGKPAL